MDRAESVSLGLWVSDGDPSLGALVGWGRTLRSAVSSLQVQPPGETPWWRSPCGPCGAGPVQGCVSPLGCHVSVGRSLSLATLTAPPRGHRPHPSCYPCSPGRGALLPPPTAATEAGTGNGRAKPSHASAPACTPAWQQGLLHPPSLCSWLFQASGGPDIPPSHSECKGKIGPEEDSAKPHWGHSFQSADWVTQCDPHRDKKPGLGPHCLALTSLCKQDPLSFTQQPLPG